MQVEFFGCRGSIPAPLNYNQVKDVVKHLYTAAIEHSIEPSQLDSFLDTQQATDPFFHGGNTSANLVSDGDTNLILEAGSGLREMGARLMQEGQTDYHILMGHFHWDHIQGFPFFLPAFIPGNTIHIYSVQPFAKEIFIKQMSAPTFPVGFPLLSADIQFHQLEEGVETEINGFSVNTLKMHHPDDSWGYRMEKGGKRICYLSDTEITNADAKTVTAYSDFVGDANIVIADSQYSFVEYFQKQHWGHSNVTTFIDILKQRDVKKLVMYHHDPAADFKMINKSLKVAKRYQELTAPHSPFEIYTAQEGGVITA